MNRIGNDIPLPATSSAYQLIIGQIADERPSLQDLDERLLNAAGANPKSLVEISGAPNTGKSLVLSELMAKCVLPTYFNGKHGDVIFIDLGHKFSVHNFLKSIISMISQSRKDSTPTEADLAALESLKSVSMLKCFSSEEFDLAFDKVEDILWENHNVALLAVDSLDAFYWLDLNRKKLRMSTHYARLTEKLRTICERHNICCAFTVNSNYLELKSKKTPEPHNGTEMVKIDYKIQLCLLQDGSRTLNGKPILIDDSGGIEFIK